MDVEASTELYATPAIPQPFTPPPPPSQLELEQAQVPPVARPEATLDTAAVAGIQEGVDTTSSTVVGATTAADAAADKPPSPTEEGSYAVPAAATLADDARAEGGGGGEADSKDGGGEGREGGGKEGGARKRPREKDLPVSEKQELMEVAVRAVLVMKPLRMCFFFFGV